LRPAEIVSLDALELAWAHRDHAAVLEHILRLLQSLDDRFGRVDRIVGTGLVDPRRLEQVATRFCAVFGAFLTDPASPIDTLAFEQLATLHRWIEILFDVGGFGGAEHLTPLLATGEGHARRVPPQNLRRFLLTFSAGGMAVDLEQSFRADPAATIAIALGCLSSRFCLSPGAHAFRERLLAWLPERLAQVRLGELALQNLASPYVHCSYATAPDKHAVKRTMIQQMRRACLEAGCVEWAPQKGRRASGAKPTIVVTAEMFVENHAIWRTHSRSVEALKAAFRVVGVARADQLSPSTIPCFDEVIAFDAHDEGFLERVRRLSQAILAQRPAMVLHLGVGLSAHVIALASLRLAPVQAASFGHTATTGSDRIDYMILPDDFVGDAACFGETVLRLPPEAMPYRMRRDVDFSAVRAAAAAARDDLPVRVALPASVMKLGPPVFEALARAAERATRPISYHVFPLGCAGLGLAELRRQLATALPTAEANEELPFPAYVQALAGCDFFVCPFPYGNMNSIVDAVLAGLPGVCLDGPEAHAHADGAYFRRFGLPEPLVARSLDDYAWAIARLASEPDWLAHCRAAAMAVDLNHPFFAGDGGEFAQAVQGLIAETTKPPA
jgi:hypothetical protein